MSEQKVDLNISKEKMTQTNMVFLIANNEKRIHTHLNLLTELRLLLNLQI